MYEKENVLIVKNMSKSKKETTKKTVKAYRYAKGLPMTAKQIKNPNKFTARVVVAYDKNTGCVPYNTKNGTTPYTYVLIGNHDHNNEHDIRRIYAKTTRINYLDARIILYDTYIKRIEAQKAEQKAKRKAKKQG